MQKERIHQISPPFSRLARRRRAHPHPCTVSGAVTLLQPTNAHAHVARVVSPCALQLTEAGAPAGGRCERDGFRLHEYEAVRSAVQLPGVPLHELRISLLDHVERPDDLPVHADADGFHVLSGAHGLLRPFGLGGGGGGEGEASLAGCVSVFRQLPIPPPARRSPPYNCTPPCSLSLSLLSLCSLLDLARTHPTWRCARRAGQRVLVIRRETPLACSLILPMRASSVGKGG